MATTGAEVAEIGEHIEYRDSTWNRTVLNESGKEHKYIKCPGVG
jgi:hypothetical protein